MSARWTSTGTVITGGLDGCLGCRAYLAGQPTLTGSKASRARQGREGPSDTSEHGRSWPRSRNAPQRGGRGVEHPLPPLGNRTRDSALAVPVPAGASGTSRVSRQPPSRSRSPLLNSRSVNAAFRPSLRPPPRRVRLAVRVVAEQPDIPPQPVRARRHPLHVRAADIPGEPGQRPSPSRRRAAAPGGPGPGCARCAAPSQPTRRPAAGPPAHAATCCRRSPGPAAGRAVARPPSPAGRPGPPRASTCRAATRTRRTAGSPSRTPASSPRPATRTATGPGTGPAPGQAGTPGQRCGAGRGRRCHGRRWSSSR